MRGIPKERRRDGWGIPKEGESQNVGAGVGGGPKIWGIPKEGSRDGIPKREEPQNVGAGMDGDPKGWEILIEGEQQWMGNP